MTDIRREGTLIDSDSPRKRHIGRAAQGELKVDDQASSIAESVSVEPVRGPAAPDATRTIGA
jgi:hypothetical protein